jgi:hypothetical protein
VLVEWVGAVVDGDRGVVVDELRGAVVAVVAVVDGDDAGELVVLRRVVVDVERRGTTVPVRPRSAGEVEVEVVEPNAGAGTNVLRSPALPFDGCWRPAGPCPNSRRMFSVARTTASLTHGPVVPHSHDSEGTHALVPVSTTPAPLGAL